MRYPLSIMPRPIRLRRIRLQSWPLAGFLFALVLVMTAGVLGTAGTGEEGVRMLIRATARSTALFFLAAFVARPLRQVWRSTASAWLLRNRRYLGVSAALSHGVHLVGILWLAVGWPASYTPETPTLVVGGLGFVLLFAMALTSSDAAVAALGRFRWQLLHRSGSWLVWFIFTFTFVPDAERGWDALHAAAVLACASAALLRLSVRVGRLLSRPAPA